MRRCLLVLALVACSGAASERGVSSDAGDAGGASDAGDAGDAGDTGPGLTLAVSPTCGSVGARVAMKLARGSTPPRCVSTSEFAAQFTGAVVIQPEQAGLSSDGFCEIDLLIPRGAQTGKVTVTTGGATYVSAVPFLVPCP